MPQAETSGFQFSARSLRNLEGVHEDLVQVMRVSIRRTPVDFAITCGLRTLEEQKELVRVGASQTLNSRHLTGHAVDIAPIVGGKVRWDWPLFHLIAPVIKQVGRELKVEMTWGGDWVTLRDGPHWELSWKAYPLPSAVEVS